MLSPFSSTHFSLSLSSPPAVLPSGHSLQLLSETGYVASAEKIKQTSTTKDKQHTSLIITYILHGERLHGEYAKTQSHNTKKKKRKFHNFSNSHFSLGVFHFLSAVVFSPVLLLSPSHLFLVWGH